MKVLDYDIVTSLPKLPVQKKTVINTINPHSYCIAEQDNEFKTALLGSDFLLPDGVGIVWASKMLRHEKVNKIAGYDVFIHLLQYLEQIKGKCFFLGASQEALNLIKAKALLEYPNVTIELYSPPFKDKFSEDDSAEMCRQVNDFKPDVLFVGMTAPKQEKWVHAHKEALNVDITCCIGAVFDFYAGTVKRPSQFWISSGLEWLPRFVKDPVRLAKRNLVSTPKFIFEVLSRKFFKRSLLSN
ncbi:WecB/TagA/CpsF family glycosyltransferase [Maribacter sp. MAR_2009_72]|uniref:WecB/TagA/CpsF family glycosyltransferase n=1 Tax=Maribacter sp. MAR_2009_72 TaxID=1250050 RepID=UPI001199F1B4|nr:WecB/TagA/CpsF family glycosyltransferase [Maribacter sp. MAR_2009_72]TVZ16950.1 N-acetylglucosaminyldiphosphoundecaprenol N-acetyl-beta-D-mannosaminyltransferase [Maribacter sp. MAR_2009_72]